MINVMRKIYLIILMISLSVSLLAQVGAAPLSKGEKQINFGIGAGSYGLPVYVGMDFAVHDDVTIGPVLSVRLDNDISIGLTGVCT